MNRVRVWLSALGSTGASRRCPSSAQVQTGSILVRVTDEQGGAVPGVAVTLSSPVLVSGTMAGVTDTGGVNRFPSLQPGIYSVKLELQGFRTVVRENVQVVVGQTVPLDLQLTRRDRRRNRDGHRHLAGGRYDEREHQRQPGRAVAAGHARRPRHLVAGRIQGAEPADHASRRRRHVRRPAGHVQRARHDQRAELQLPERHQRRRSGGDRRGRLLLRLRRVRRHPGLDRRARHHRADERRVPEHGDQERRRAAGAAARRSRGWATRRRRRTSTTSCCATASVPKPTASTSSRTSTSAAAVRSSPASCACSVVPRLARARQRPGGVLDAGARQDRHHVGPRSTPTTRSTTRTA